MPFVIIILILLICLLVSISYIYDGQMELPRWSEWKYYKSAYRTRVIFWDLVASGFSILLPFIIMGIPIAWMYFSYNALEPEQIVEARIVNEVYDGRIKYQYAEYKYNNDTYSLMISNGAVKYFQYDNENYEVKVKAYDNFAYWVYWMRIDRIIIKKRSEDEN